jgi:hypothetical protein
MVVRFQLGDLYLKCKKIHLRLGGLRNHEPKASHIERILFEQA